MLFGEFEKLSPSVAALKDEGRYEEALARIASLRPVVDKFFDDVMVMADDERVRDNRLAFLARLRTEFSTIADFNEIVSGDG